MLIQRYIWLLAVIWLALTAGNAWAGAWPREKGTGFSATSVRLSWPQDVLRGMPAPRPSQYNTFYFEYGLTDRISLGLDLGRSVSGQDKTVLFLGTPLRNHDKGPKMAFQLGFGRVAGQTVVRPGLSIGWGLKNGWLSMDAVAELSVDNGTTDSKLDITWGRNLDKGRKLILQMQTGDTALDPPFARFAPSYVFPLSDRIKLEAGGSWGLIGDKSVGIKLGIWASF